jgi:hypothetical protein
MFYSIYRRPDYTPKWGGRNVFNVGL